MSVSSSLEEGTDVVNMVSISPDSIAYVNHKGAVFHPQDENNNQNISFYEITGTTDEIDFNTRRYTREYNRPILTLHTIFGPTDFDVVDRSQGRTIISEVSGFDTEVWNIDITDSSPELRLTNFGDTTAAFYPFVGVFNRIS